MSLEKSLSCGCLALLLLAGSPGVAETVEKSNEPEPLPGVAERLKGSEPRAGVLSLHLDREGHRIWLELPPPDAHGDIVQLLYVSGLTTGVGSNSIGLDRSQQGETRWVRFRRLGRRVLLEEINPGYRALSEDPAEVSAVEDSFAFSVLWSGPVAALDPDGRSLVDLAPFLVVDTHRIVETLKRTEQGEFAIDPERSVADLDAVLAFPDNVELEAVVTFAGKEPGAQLRATVPAPESVSLVLHHSFIRLPDDGYEPRALDPRAPSFGISFMNYAAPLDQPVEVRWIARHRLRKVDPTAARSPVVEPIVYYLDRGVPEPVRSALLEGASWWADAFDAVGLEDAFRVEMLPEGADPLDVRYNVIQWVHRATRGWSYGGGVIDPRTGEIVKGHVLLGSLRVRQDRLIFEGLLGAEKTGSGAPDDPVQLALARLRQLAAHEVGHTLGFTHNFAASTYQGRASVMDYPAPKVGITPEGELDVSDAYAVGFGVWDAVAVGYAYGEYPPGVDEKEALDRYLAGARDAGFLFLSDDDARPPGSASPVAHLWDNGADAAAGLAESLRVRRIALDHFGLHNLAPGRPVALLQEVLVPVYFHHRYQLEAAVKLVGGLSYRYALVGEPEPEAEPVSAVEQRRALAAILPILDPAELDLPESVLELLLPRPFGYSEPSELFAGKADPVFDPLEAAGTAADAVASLLLEPTRLARLVDQHRRDPGLPGLEEVVDALLERSFARSAPEPERLAELRRMVERTVVGRMMERAAEPGLPARVGSRLEAALAALASRWSTGGRSDRAEAAHRAELARAIERFLQRELLAPQAAPRVPEELPPGGPIGARSAGAALSCTLP